MATEEEAKKEIVDALLALRNVLTQSKQECLSSLDQHQEVKKLLAKIERVLAPHSDVLDPQHNFRDFLDCDVLPLERLPARPDVIPWLDYYLAGFDYTATDGGVGVSLLDAAAWFDSDDVEAQRYEVKRLVNSKKITAVPIGKCPNDGRALLYRLSELVSDLQKIRSLEKRDVTQLRQHLKTRQRRPKPA